MIKTRIQYQIKNISVITITRLYKNKNRPFRAGFNHRLEELRNRKVIES